jgi:transposase
MIPAVTERCAGIDVGRKWLAICVMTGPANGEARSEIRQFGTTVPELKRAREWIVSEQCTDVIMESTGSYWKPVFNILEGSIKVALAMKSRRGRAGRPTTRMPGGWRICYGTGDGKLHSATPTAGTA